MRPPRRWERLAAMRPPQRLTQGRTQPQAVALVVHTVQIGAVRTEGEGRVLLGRLGARGHQGTDRATRRLPAASIASGSVEFGSEAAAHGDGRNPQERRLQHLRAAGTLIHSVNELTGWLAVSGCSAELWGWHLSFPSASLFPLAWVCLIPLQLRILQSRRLAPVIRGHLLFFIC